MNFNYEGIALIPIITIIVNILKKTGVSNKWLPIISLGIGVVFGMLFLTESDIRKRLLLGIVMGMSASGLYSNGKEISKSIPKEGTKHDNKK